MALQGYKVVYEGGSGEIVEKKSRFLAAVQPVESEEAAAAFIGAVKKKYWDASHNCSAFTIGRHHELTRCSDDGEPSGTAGRPMLDVLLREDIHNVAVVVTRYFGGTLLGTGGLVRAYQKAVHAGLSNCVLIDKKIGKKLTIQTDYNGLGKIQYILAQQEITVIETDYTESVRMHVMVPIGCEKRLTEAVTEGTGGTAGLYWGEETEFAMLNGEMILFDSKNVKKMEKKC